MATVQSGIAQVQSDALQLSQSASAANATTTTSIISQVLYFLSWVSFRLLGTALITVPSWVFGLLSTSFSITLSFTALVLIVGSVFIASMLFVRYRALTGYTKTVNERREPPKVDAFPNTREQGEKRRFGSYLDEFLIAIKVFGYLEKPVFNELTKSMRTQKLDAGEVLDLDENPGFAIVCEGNVQIFTKVDNTKSNVRIDDEFAGEVFVLNGQRYQLLNEVKTGNPLSSLVNILTLFTDEDPAMSGVNSPLIHQAQTSSGFGFINSTPAPSDPDKIDPLNLDGSLSSEPSTPRHCQTPEIIARATDDSTIAIIPTDAFKRLKRKHPRASSHIVQMILTRLYRVTFQTAHYYLGLTHELFDTELKLNSTAKLDIPSYLQDGVLRKFNQQGSTVTGSPFPDRGRSKINTNARTSSARGRSRDASTSSLLSPTSMKEKKAMPRLNRTSSRHVILESRDSFHPGDLLSSVPLSRQDQASGQTDDVINRSFSANEETEETSLRIALAEGMFRFMGINKESLIPRQNSIKSVNSALNSPAPPSFGDYPSFTKTKENQHYYGSAQRFHSPKFRSMSRASSSVSSEIIGDELDFESAKMDFSRVIDLQKIDSGTVIIEQNSSSNGLYYVFNGEFEVSYKDSDTGKERILHTVTSGGMAGYIGALVRYKSFVTVKAKKDSIVAFLSTKDLEILCEKYFMIYLTIAKSLINSLSDKILKLDSALEWVQLDAGETLFKQDTFANGIYIILSGRLRSLQEDPTTHDVKIMSEYGQGESFGEFEVLTAAKRSSSFVAVRDSEAARIPRTLFETLSLENPSIMIKVSRIVAKTLTQDQGKTHYDAFKVPLSNESRCYPTSKNYRTITILPTTSGLPVAEFAMRLIQAFKNVNISVIGLDQSSTLTHLGRYAFDKLSRLRQSGFFSDLEERYEIVVYIADTTVNSTWTSTCIQQADCILLLADAFADPGVGEYERLLLKARSTARTELILLHQEKYVEPGSTSKWLKNRIWVHAHHHIQLSFKTSDTKYTPHQNTPSAIAHNIKSKVETLTAKYIRVNSKRHYTSPMAHQNDFLRLARLLSGQAVGLVLGGGGARGISHLGVLRALQESGIPIDIVGGTSIGAFIGGLYANYYDLVPIYGRAKKFAGRIGSVWRTLSDLTIPITAYTTGHEFNRGIWKAFGDTRIEDFWIQYFCNSTNITNSCMEIHSSGIAWRYIRASMSLAGLLPPMTDNGSMLLDGGYVDNLPVDEMKNRGVSIIFAIDVGSVDDRSPMTFGDSLSGSWALWNKWNPFSTHPNVPAMSEIQMRLGYVSSVNALERAKITPGVIYLRPPVENYATLGFGMFEEIYNVGITYGQDVLKELNESGKLPKIAAAGMFEQKKDRLVQRRNSI